jgi:hypothetical protein
VGEGSFGDLSPLVPSMRPQDYSRACVSKVDELLLVNDASRRGDLDPGARTRCCLWQEFRNVNLRLAAAEAGAVDRIVPSSCENPGRVHTWLHRERRTCSGDLSSRQACL